MGKKESNPSPPKGLKRPLPPPGPPKIIGEVEVMKCWNGATKWLKEARVKRLLDEFYILKVELEFHDGYKSQLGKKVKKMQKLIRELFSLGYDTSTLPTIKTGYYE